jgi:hypothetical protein
MVRGPENREMPNLFIIGAGKCGTSSLHAYLDLHPEISMSDVKEPMYFLRSLLEDSDRPHIASREEYLRLFRPGTKIRGEASVGYSVWPRFTDVPQSIADECDDPRFVFLVDDPVERIPRIAAQKMSSSIESHRIEDVSKPLREQIGDLDDPANVYICSGRYMTQVRQYLERFPRESILVLDSNDLRVNRDETLAEAFAFLEVDPGFRHPGFARRENESADLRRKSAVYRRMVNWSPLRRIVYRLPRATRQKAIGAVSGALSSPVEKPEIDPDLREDLASLYRDEVAELREFTGKEFPTWSL